MGLSLNGTTPWLNNMPTGGATSYRPTPALNPNNGPANEPLPQQQREQAQIAEIQTRYAGQTGGISPGKPNQKADDVLAKVRAESESHIRSHEAAHQAAAGSLGGSMSIQYDQNGVAFAGQVPISIPPMDKNNPESSLKNYQTVRFAALAPGDPSGQDLAVASRAQALMGQAQVLIARKRQAKTPSPSQAPG